MKFLCDEMLIRLGKWLRAAGYNTAIAKRSSSDKEILEQALTEERILLTRDAHFKDIVQKRRPKVIWLKANNMEELVRELKGKVKINWQHKPFTLCLLCNEKLEAVDKDKLKNTPNKIIEDFPKLFQCPGCQRVYWEGSHFKRMLDTLQRWNHLS